MTAEVETNFTAIQKDQSVGFRPSVPGAMPPEKLKGCEIARRKDCVIC